MKLTFIGRQMTVGEDQKVLAAKKLAKLDKFFGPDGEATVTFRYKKDKEIIEITIPYGGVLFRSEEEDVTFQNALDSALDTLTRQIRKNKTRLEKRLREGAFPEGEAAEEEEETFFDIRTKTFPAKPMSVDEAILQMNLLEHQFFAFSNAEDDNRTCVVYRRKDGAYGLLIPE